MTAMHASAVLRTDMFSGTSLNTVLGATAHLAIYSGTAPVNADTALSGNTLLASLALAATPVASVTSGVATLGTIASATAGNTGTATFWRILDSAGTPACQVQGDVSATGGGGDLTLPTTSIVSGETISVSSGTIGLPV
jgi:hypothetical protein